VSGGDLLPWSTRAYYGVPADGSHGCDFFPSRVRAHDLTAR
jgi:hypothetical protein